MNVIIVGGDRRMIFAAKRLSERHGCAVLGFEHTGVCGIPVPETGQRFNCAVLPIFAKGEEIPCPFGGEKLNIEQLTGYLEPGALVFAGKVFPRLCELCSANGWELYDYLEREELAVLNAVLTAEAAAAVVINETDRAVFGSEVLVLGFGRIGKLTARYFAALGAKVTAAARKPADLAWIRACGYTAADITDKEELSGALSRADIILNTVPAPILAGAAAAPVRPDALLVELASVSCTDSFTDFRVVKAGGLPGKTAPVTAGYIIAETTENIMYERRKQNGGA